MILAPAVILARQKAEMAQHKQAYEGTEGHGLGLKQLQATLLEQIVLAMKRMRQGGSYKRWRFSKDTPEFSDVSSFR